jgi:uncharacterized protein YqeY
VANNGIRQRLDQELRQALRAKDKIAMSALRSALAAIGNAGAVPAAPAPAGGTSGSPHFAGSTAGPGTSEAERRILTEGDAVQVVQAEIAERMAAAQEYQRTQHTGRADRLRREAAVLQSVLDTGNAH